MPQAGGDGGAITRRTDAGGWVALCVPGLRPPELLATLVLPSCWHPSPWPPGQERHRREGPWGEGADGRRGAKLSCCTVHNNDAEGFAGS